MPDDDDKIDTALHLALTSTHLKAKGMEAAISVLLRYGVILSTVVVVAGGVMLIGKQGGEIVSLKNFHGQSIELSSLGDIVQAAIALKPMAVIQLGLLMLVATPIARVALSILLFWKKGDYLYVGITTAVLTILFFAILLGN